MNPKESPKMPDESPISTMNLPSLTARRIPNFSNVKSHTDGDYRATMAEMTQSTRRQVEAKAKSSSSKPHLRRLRTNEGE
ncbi:hypothetical protein D8674_021319 [Pyrus ussuriensis x Pyrus communis]|uniref:Uncharacterized protein n=1 Tax=Pyrus ussuriensis x Pyrus communis TaxID=2448454 RepID=A0A5N5GLJ4_9ROSA|nr:hypothetical protein D8674_021319 [Pyrus ussuriensis x Pyrus communis]